MIDWFGLLFRGQAIQYNRNIFSELLTKRAQVIYYNEDDSQIFVCLFIKFGAI